ncbi:MAG: hypothetical protein RMJ56_04460 [Gemmataceae bacterium]|nr:hypothetical protein [Gemmata sp.]MDW8196841.1 hypothetical protein [Gemmataceae bacterium]
MKFSFAGLAVVILALLLALPATAEANARRQRRVVATPTIPYNPPRPLAPSISVYPSLGTQSLAPLYIYPYYAAYPYAPFYYPTWYYPTWSAGYYVTPGAFSTTVSPWGTYYYFTNPGVYYWYRIR